jgi:hypothetical protein
VAFDVLVPRERIKGNRVMVRVIDTCNNEQTASVAIGDGKRR